MVQRKALTQEACANIGVTGVGSAWGEKGRNEQPSQLPGTHPLFPQMLASAGHGIIPFLLNE